MSDGDPFDEIAVRHKFQRGPILQELATFPLNDDILPWMTYDETHRDAHIIERILNRVEEARIANDYVIFHFDKYSQQGGIFNNVKEFDDPPLNLESDILFTWNTRRSNSRYNSDIIPLRNHRYVGFCKSKLCGSLIDGRHMMFEDQRGEYAFYTRFFNERSQDRNLKMETQYHNEDLSGEFMEHFRIYPNREYYNLCIFPAKPDSDDQAILRGRNALNEPGNQGTLPQLVLEVLDAENEKLKRYR